MKNQVTTIEQSKRLLELGVLAEKAGMVWEYWINQDFSQVPSEEVYYNLNTKSNRDVDSCDEDIPAFTVADLLGALPCHCRMPDGAWINMEIGKWEGVWRLAYYQMASGSDEVLCGGAGREYYFSQQSTLLIDLLYGAAEWLLSNKCELKI